MAKTSPIGVRLDPAVKSAIEQAALTDDRPISTMIAKIVTDWCRAKGLSPNPKALEARKRGSKGVERPKREAVG